MATPRALDAGPEGVERSIAALLDAGLEPAGLQATASAASPAAARHLAGEIDIAHLAFSDLDTAGDAEGLVGLLDDSAIIAAVRDARLAGAEFVVVSLHWGEERQREPSAMQTDVATRLARQLVSRRVDPFRAQPLLVW